MLCLILAICYLVGMICYHVVIYVLVFIIITLLIFISI